MTRANYLITRK